jgi:zinc transporter ZupT
MKSCNKNRSLLGIANAFSGGIFLAIALLHIIPEAHTHYLVYLHKGAVEDSHSHEIPPMPEKEGILLQLGGNHGNPRRELHGVDNVHEFLEMGFPLPYLMVFLGYTFILLIDKVMFDSHELLNDHGHNPLRESIRHSLFDTRKRSNSHSDFKLEISNGKELHEDKKNYNEFKDEDEQNDQEVDDNLNEGIRRYLSKAERFSARVDTALSKKHRRGAKRTARNVNLKANTGPVQSQRAEFAQESDTGDSFVKGSPNESDNIRNIFKCDLTPYILMIALSVHSVFEGIAVGLQDEVADIWSFLIAIGAHKWAAAMSLGISMSTNLEHNPNTVKLLILIFALATPIGIVIGMIVMESAELINIIFSGLAGGTFLYIAASEVVVEEFSVSTDKWSKLFGFMLGALIITFVTGLEEE